LRPRLLDLFCGGGGASAGYHRAGFDVVGVDINPQPRYPFEFVQTDALTFPLDGFDAIHASPPCQGYSSMRHLTRARLAKWNREPKPYPLLLGEVRARLCNSGVPFVIENVVGSPLRKDIMLCGSMFGLRVRRHRLFETTLGAVLQPQCQHFRHNFIGVYGRVGDGRRLWSPGEARRGGAFYRQELRAAKSTAEAGAAMGIDWMEWDEIREAIPPAYTEFVGRLLLQTLGVESCSSSTT